MSERTERMIYRTIPHTIQHADTFATRLRGLMFRKRPLDLEALLITPCNSIHMCFMHFPIDAVFLNKENHVIKLIPNLKPWRFVLPVKDAHSVLELPCGAIYDFEIQLHDYLQF
ncbi:DUF192 domain-containing protein [Guptibacillus algicola]|uniref:DUF192 domain-containing protein n=1 Tax=Guptibacillus algicola TaxID=225844 RepID=UPI001CD1FBC8|nr:DUF192 domain-containing protein [Alkalihalobacillus algicola]MCA0987528.1 DUF192 domain-containing protein [Alkalihalobacillus algicola]